MTFHSQNISANLISTQKDKYALLVVFRVLSNLCIAGLIVVFGYMYIHLNGQNRELASENSSLEAELATLSVQLQNIESELAQKGNIQLLKKAPELNLRQPTTAQVYILDSPNPLQIANENGINEDTIQQVADY